MKAVWMLSTKVLQCGLSTDPLPRESSMYTCEDGPRPQPALLRPPACGQEQAGSLPGPGCPHSQQVREDALGCHTQPSDALPLVVNSPPLTAHPFTKSAYARESTLTLAENLGPVLVLVRGHEEVTHASHGHQAVPLDAG